jgi:hypothetical protein
MSRRHADAPRFGTRASGRELRAPTLLQMPDVAGHCPHSVPPAFAGTPRFLAPRRNRPRLRSGTSRNSMGSEWGPERFRIGSTTADVSAIHWLAREQAPKARAVSPPGGRLGLTSGDPRLHRRDRPRRKQSGEPTAPNPGTSWRGAARRRRKAGRALERRAIGTGAPGECRGRPRVNARVGCRRRARPALKEACAAAEVSTGTN